MNSIKKNLIIFSLFLFPISNEALAQIDKDINGPRYACVNVPVSYTTGPAVCEQNYWRVTYQGNPVLDYQPSGCAQNTYFYYNQSVININSPLSLTCNAQPFFNIYQQLPITFKLPGIYTIEATPKGKVEGAPSFCNSESTTIYVGSAAIGNYALTGSTQLSNCAGQASFSVPDAGHVNYQWSLSSNLRPNVATINTASPAVTFNLNAFSIVGNECGTLTLTTISKCGDPNQTKSWPLCRGVTHTISGSLTGASVVNCNKLGIHSVGIAAVPGAVSYTWYISPADVDKLKISSYQTSTTTPWCQINYNTSSGSFVGNIVAKANFPCNGSTPSFTRTIMRKEVDVQISGPVPTGIVCRGKSYTLSATDGIPASWTVKQYGSGGSILSNVTSITPTAGFTITDSRVTAVSWDLSYTKACTGGSAISGGGSGVYPASSSYCVGVTSVSEIPINKSEVHSISVYPNPVMDVLKIQGIEKLEGTSVNIYDRFNKLVLNESDALQNEINIGRLQNGFYYIHILNGRKILHKERILIKR